jgi:hypothetical protein
VGKLLEAIGDLPGLIELRSTGRAVTDVRAEGGQAEAPLAVDEEIDLVGK